MSLTEGEISASDPQGRPLWKARGKTIKTDEKKGVALFTQGSCQLFDQGVMTLRLQADTIEVNYDAKPLTMSLTGNVVAQSPKEGWAFRAPQVRAVIGEKRVGKITAERDVHLQKGNLKIQGEGMVADVSLKRVTFEDAISVLELPQKGRGQR
jgi:LPS export ABC transporter protein LptC